MTCSHKTVKKKKIRYKDLVYIYIDTRVNRMISTVKWSLSHLSESRKKTAIIYMRHYWLSCYICGPPANNEFENAWGKLTLLLKWGGVLSFFFHNGKLRENYLDLFCESEGWLYNLNWSRASNEVLTLLRVYWFYLKRKLLRGEAFHERVLIEFYCIYIFFFFY